MLIDDRYCLECVNCKYKDTYGEGHKLYQCWKVQSSHHGANKAIMGDWLQGSKLPKEGQ